MLMVNIGFIVGKGGDVYPFSAKSKKAPLWFRKGILDFMDFINQDGSVPSDVALATFINYTFKNANVRLIDGTQSNKLTVSDLNKFDVIYVIYDALEVFHCGTRKTCPLLAKSLEQKLIKTTAFVYPHPDFHKYIINKPVYYKDLRRFNIPLAPFFSTTPENVIKAPAHFKNKILEKGWKGVIVKPSYAGYSMGIKVFKDISRTKPTTLKNHFIKLQQKSFPNVVVQEFIPSFGKNYEIRTFWINEEYAYSVGTLTEKVGGDNYGLLILEHDTFMSEGGTISDTVLNRLKPVAKKVLKVLPKYPIKHPLVRIDFGCCLRTNSCIESYFVNEVETMAANLLLENTDYPVIEKLGPVVYNFAVKIKGKQNIKGTKVATTKLTIKDPCKPV